MTPFGVTEAILPVEPSPNQMLPSGPGVMNAGLLRLGSESRSMSPRGVIRATLLLLERVNQKLPSSLIVMLNGWLPPRYRGLGRNATSPNDKCGDNACQFETELMQKLYAKLER